jgi:hypothetical protein
MTSAKAFSCLSDCTTSPGFGPLLPYAMRDDFWSTTSLRVWPRSMRICVCHAICTCPFRPAIPFRVPALSCMAIFLPTMSSSHPPSRELLCLRLAGIVGNWWTGNRWNAIFRRCMVVCPISLGRCALGILQAGARSSRYQPHTRYVNRYLVAAGRQNDVEERGLLLKTVFCPQVCPEDLRRITITRRWLHVVRNYYARRKIRQFVNNTELADDLLHRHLD